MTRSIYDMADALADKLDILDRGKPHRIERAETIDRPIASFTKRHLWPADVWAEMEAIRKGEIE